MDYGDIFLFILLFISGLIIIHLLHRIKFMKKAINEDAIKVIENNWDEDYKKIIAYYGTVGNYIKSHQDDFNIIRSNLLVYVSRIKAISSGITKAVDMTLETLNNKEDSVGMKLGILKRASTQAIDNIVSDMTGFIKSEESAHNGEEKADKILDKLSKEIRELNFYE